MSGHAQPAPKRAREASYSSSSSSGCTSPINGLPAELLALVLSRAGIWSAWRSRRVCQRWRTTIDAHRWTLIALEADGKTRLDAVRELVQRGKITPASGAAVELKLVIRPNSTPKATDQHADAIVAGGVNLLGGLHLAAHGQLCSVRATLVYNSTSASYSTVSPGYASGRRDKELTVIYSFVSGSLAALHPLGPPAAAPALSICLDVDGWPERKVDEHYLQLREALPLADDMAALLRPVAPASLSLLSPPLAVSAHVAAAVASSLAASLRVVDMCFDSPEALAALGPAASLEDLTVRSPYGGPTSNAFNNDHVVPDDRECILNGLVLLAESAAGRSLKRLTLDCKKGSAWSGAVVRAVASMPLLESIKDIVIADSRNGPSRQDMAALGGMPKLRSLRVQFVLQTRSPMLLAAPLLGLADAVLRSPSLSELSLTLPDIPAELPVLQLLQASRPVLSSAALSLNRAATKEELAAIVSAPRLGSVRIGLRLARMEDLLLLRALSALRPCVKLSLGVRMPPDGPFRLAVVQGLLSAWLPAAAVSVQAYGPQ